MSSETSLDEPAVGFSPLHPHEPERAPILDPEGRCLVCSYSVAMDEYTGWRDGRRSWMNLGPNAPHTPDVIARMDAAEVEKWGTAAVTTLRLIVEIERREASLTS